MLFVLAFISTFILTPLLAKKLKEKGIVGVDFHKEEKPRIPEMGGIAILIGFLIAMSLIYSKILVAVLVTSLVGIVGIVDRFKKLTPLQKMVSLSAIGLLLIHPLNEYNLLYLISIPILFMCACNFTNMLAGFNGLEIGTGAIACLTVAIMAKINYSFESFSLALAMAGSLLAFLYFNKYPAKVFPGDVGTLPIGAVLFSSIAIGGFTVGGFFIFLPYIIDASLKFISAGIMTRESHAPTYILNGKLKVPEKGYLSLPRLILKIKPMSEKEIVLTIWAIEAGFCILGISLEYLVH
jgi:UDP-N-acetylglucosamine--dolichyl-phosphate N-acetylglucosaminephosphotransferase